MIIETTDNRFYSVIENASPELAHCWKGWQVKLNRKTGQWVYVDKNPKAHGELVRKEATRVVEV